MNRSDLYLKSVLTIIAIALGVIAFKMPDGGRAMAMGDGCGGRSNPCYVDAGFHPLEVRITNLN